MVRLRVVPLLLLIPGGVACAAAPCWVEAAGPPGPDAVWTLLAGPVDPQPTWDPRAIQDAARHRMVVVDAFNPGVLWILSLPATEPPRWLRIPIPGVTPPPRWNAAAVYDSLRDRVVVFGGSTYGKRSYNDVWTLSLGDPPQWSEVLPGGQPPTARESPFAVYDPPRDRMIVYGGYSQDSSRALGDTWELSFAGGPAWAPLAPAGLEPGARDAGCAVFDPWNDRMVAFGGDETVWALSLEGAPAWDSLHVTTARPPARLVAAAVVDPGERRMVLHGGTLTTQWGTTLSDTWAFQLDGPPAWNRLPTHTYYPSVMQQAAIYSPERNSVIQFGGAPNAFANACEELDLASLVWSPILPDAPATFPSRRADSFLTVEDSTGRLFVYSGVLSGCPTDLWTFGGAGGVGWTLLAPGGYIPVCSSQFLGFDKWGFVRDTRRNRLLAIHGDAFWGLKMDQIFALPLDGSGGWRQLPIAGPEPLGRWYPSLVYDPVRDRVLMFGGVILGNRAADSGQSLDELWALSMGDTVRWTLLVPRGTPWARDSHSAMYDARRDRMVVFGGQKQTAQDLGGSPWPRRDTWALSLAHDDLSWSLLSPDGPNSGPAVLDTLHDCLVDWPGDSTLWVLPLGGDGTWQRLAAAGDLPTPRIEFGLTFDPTQNRVLFFGGALAAPGNSGFPALAADLYELRLAGLAAIVLERAETAWDHVLLSWTGLPAGTALAVVRSPGDSAWVTLGTVAAGADGRAAFTDRAVAPRGRYVYALSYPGGEQRYGETVVLVPPAPALALPGFQPNPSGRQVAVALTLPDDAPARLELLDVTGRRVASLPLGGLGPGPHLVSLGSINLRPGLYFMRLTHRGDVLTARGVIIK